MNTIKGTDMNDNSGYWNNEEMKGKSGNIVVSKKLKQKHLVIHERYDMHEDPYEELHQLMDKGWVIASQAGSIITEYSHYGGNHNRFTPVFSFILEKYE